MNRDQVILILDDEVISALGLQVQLRAAGFHHVYTASSYDRAVELYRQVSPDAAIVDINLQSDRTGFDFIREADRLSTIIILTGYEQSFYESELREICYNEFLEKPAQIDAIVNALR